MRDFAKIAMNPVRQRIIQYLLLNGKGTAGEIKEELSDIPTASLYRHIKILLEGGCIEVLEEKKIRGTVEKTYGLIAQPMGAAPGQEEVAQLIQSSLMSIMISFRQYFSENKEADPSKDMIFMSASTLLLTEAEFMEMTGRMGAVINDYIQNKPGQGRQPRRLTMISSPCEE